MVKFWSKVSFCSQTRFKIAKLGVVNRCFSLLQARLKNGQIRNFGPHQWPNGNAKHNSND